MKKNYHKCEYCGEEFAFITRCVDHEVDVCKKNPARKRKPDIADDALDYFVKDNPESVQHELFRMVASLGAKKAREKERAVNELKESKK